MKYIINSDFIRTNNFISIYILLFKYLSSTYELYAIKKKLLEKNNELFNFTLLK